jgi:hypothetical protein
VLEWEVLEANIANFKKHVAMREWEQHQKAVVDALERGELSHNSPEYVEHQRRTVELFGPGSSGFHRHESLWGTLGCAATGSDGDTGGDAQLLEDNEGS